MVTTARMRWDDADESIASDKIAFVLVELEKFRRRYNALDEEVMRDEMLAWLYLLTCGFKDEREVDEIMDKFPTLEEFAELYGFALNDPKVVRAYDDMVSAEREYNARQDWYKRLREEGFQEGYNDGVEQGRKDGVEQGIEQGIEQTIARLRELGADESLIAALRDGD